MTNSKTVSKEQERYLPDYEELTEEYFEVLDELIVKENIEKEKTAKLLEIQKQVMNVALPLLKNMNATLVNKEKDGHTDKQDEDLKAMEKCLNLIKELSFIEKEPQKPEFLENYSENKKKKKIMESNLN